MPLPAFERGVVILSIDTEQIWGYLDCFNEEQYQRRFPGATEAHEKLLVRLRAAGVSATWFVVGGMALRESTGACDSRFSGLPPGWTCGIPAGSETTAPAWYRHAFIERLRDARPLQEIGLHGGLSHLIWTDSHAARDIVKWELTEGIKVLEQAGMKPRSFSFARNEEAHHDLLPPHAIKSFRGRPQSLAFQLGRTMPGALMRVLDELACSTPPPVWPQEVLPGLWNIPSSLFLYPIGPARTRVTGFRSRIKRFGLGLQAAARARGIFHFSLHPENLAESPSGFGLFDDMLEKLTRARDEGDIEVLTMSDVAERMEWRLEGHCAAGLLACPRAEGASTLEK